MKGCDHHTEQPQVTVLKPAEGFDRCTEFTVHLKILWLLYICTFMNFIWFNANSAGTHVHEEKSVYFIVLGAVSLRKTVLPGMAIPMLKIRRPNGRLIFNMEIAIRR